VKTNRRKFSWFGHDGRGKTTVAPGGASSRNASEKTFYDADREIEARTGVSVAVIFDIGASPAFRKREAEVLEQLTSSGHRPSPPEAASVLMPATASI